MTVQALRRIWRAIDGPKPCADADCCGRTDCRTSVRGWLIHCNERHGLDFRGVELGAEVELEQEPDLLTLRAAAPQLRGDEVLWFSRRVSYGLLRGEIVDGGCVDLATGVEV